MLAPGRQSLVTASQIKEWQSSDYPYPTGEDERDDREASLLNRGICLLGELGEFEPYLDRIATEPFIQILRDNFTDIAALEVAQCAMNALVYLHPNSISRYFHPIAMEVNKANKVMIAPNAVFKASKDQLYHEAFVGLYGTNQIRKTIPHFAFVFAAFRCGKPIGTAPCKGKKEYEYVVYENVHNSVPLAKYVQSCTSKEFIQIYLQVLYALWFAHQTLDFTHYDLHSGNVLVRYLPEVRNITMPSKQGPVFFNTNTIPTIIDYGFSHILYQGRHYGAYRLLEFGVMPDASFPLSDAFKLLASCAKDATKNQSVYSVIEDIFHFFSDESPSYILYTTEYIFLPPPLRLTAPSLDDFIQYIYQRFPDI